MKFDRLSDFTLNYIFPHTLNLSPKFILRPSQESIMSNYLNLFKEEVYPDYFPVQRETGNKSVIRQLAATISLWNSRSRQRADLKDLDSRLLRDIGVSREQALHEAEKSFWEK